MAVRSRRLFGPAQCVTSGLTVLYTVPSGRTAVVRAAMFTLIGTVTNQVRWRLGMAGLEVARFELAAFQVITFQDQVLDSGESWRFSAHTVGGSPVNVSLFGSLLLGNPE